MDLVLGPLTVILGPSMAGKSAVVRAIRNLATAALGHSFVRHGAKKAVVVAQIGEHTIGWAKGKEINKYKLDEITFDKIGRETPAAIRELLNLGIIELDGQRICVSIQEQLDPPFLIGEVGSVISETIGSTVGFHRLVRVVEFVATRIRQIQAETKPLTEELTKLGTKLERLAIAPGLEEQLASATGFLAACDQKLGEQAQWLIKLESAWRLSAEVSKGKARLVLLDQMLEFRKHQLALAAIESKVQSLRSVSALVRETKAQLTLFDSLKELITLRSKVQLWSNMLQTEASLIANMSAVKERVINLERKTKELIKKAFAELSPGQVCPVCARPIDAQCVTEVQQYYLAKVK